MDMESVGLTPGPRAWHSVIFAYVKAKDAMGALDATRAAWRAGIQPLPESYTVLIHAFMEAGDTAKAIAVLESMWNAGVDARPGWAMLTTSLFRAGLGEDAMAYVQYGKEQGWAPNSTLMEHIIAYEVREARESRPKRAAEALQTARWPWRCMQAPHGGAASILHAVEAALLSRRGARDEPALLFHPPSPRSPRRRAIRTE